MLEYQRLDGNQLQNFKKGKGSPVFNPIIEARSDSGLYTVSPQVTVGNLVVGCQNVLPGNLFSCRASLPFGQYLIILLGNKGMKVEWPGVEPVTSESQVSQSDALLCHHVTEVSGVAQWKNVGL